MTLAMHARGSTEIAMGISIHPVHAWYHFSFGELIAAVTAKTCPQTALEPLDQSFSFFTCSSGVDQICCNSHVDHGTSGVKGYIYVCSSHA